MSVLYQFIRHFSCFEVSSGSGQMPARNKQGIFCNFFFPFYLEFPNLKILALVYNRRLSAEMNQRMQLLGITNLEVRTYHALGVHYYSSECKSDVGISRVTAEKQRPNRALNFDIICMDEQQDMTPVLYNFVKMVLLHNKVDKLSLSHLKSIQNGVQLASFGDPKQEIFTYNGAYSQFLTLAEEVFPSTRSWETICHNTTHRFGNALTQFINALPLCPPYNQPIIAFGDGLRPQYVKCRAFDGTVKDIVLGLIAKKVSADQILVLAPSVLGSGNTPVARLANTLSRKHNIRVYVPGESASFQDVCSIFQFSFLYFLTPC